MNSFKDDYLVGSGLQSVKWEVLVKAFGFRRSVNSGWTRCAAGGCGRTIIRMKFNRIKSVSMESSKSSEHRVKSVASECGCADVRMSRWYLNPIPVSSGFGSMRIGVNAELFRFKVQSSKQGTITRLLSIPEFRNSGFRMDGLEEEVKTQPECGFEGVV